MHAGSAVNTAWLSLVRFPSQNIRVIFIRWVLLYIISFRNIGSWLKKSDTRNKCKTWTVRDIHCDTQGNNTPRHRLFDRILPIITKCYNINSGQYHELIPRPALDAITSHECFHSEITHQDVDFVFPCDDGHQRKTENHSRYSLLLLYQGKSFRTKEVFIIIHFIVNNNFANF